MTEENETEALVTQIQLSSGVIDTEETKTEEVKQEKSQQIETQQQNSNKSIYVLALYMKTISVTRPEKYETYRNINITFNNREICYNVNLDENNNGIIDDYAIFIKPAKNEFLVYGDIFYTLDFMGPNVDDITFKMDEIEFNQIYKNQRFPLQFDADAHPNTILSIFGDYCLFKYSSKNEYYRSLYNNTYICNELIKIFSNYLNVDINKNDITKNFNSGRLYYKSSNDIIEYKLEIVNKSIQNNLVQFYSKKKYKYLYLFDYIHIDEPVFCGNNVENVTIYLSKIQYDTNNLTMNTYNKLIDSNNSDIIKLNGIHNECDGCYCDMYEQSTCAGYKTVLISFESINNDCYTSIIVGYGKNNNNTSIISNNKLTKFITDNTDTLLAIYDDMHQHGQFNPGFVIKEYDDLVVPILNTQNINNNVDFESYKIHEIKVLIEALDNHINLFYNNNDFNEGEKINLFDRWENNFKFFRYLNKKCYFLSKQSSDFNLQYIGSKNITLGLKIMLRKTLLIDLLKGQDDEFNIFRSYYFDEDPSKISFAVLSLIISFGLTIVLILNIINDIDVVFEQDDPIIFVLSVLVFLCLGELSFTTMNSYSTFYRKSSFLFKIPYFLKCSDFMLNVILPITVTLISFFLLSSSDTYLDLVLNAFALTFIVEIDDMLNVFESDEDNLIESELKIFMNYNQTNPYGKSKRVITYQNKAFFKIVQIPFTFIKSIYFCFYYFFEFFIKKEDQNQTLYYIQQTAKKLSAHQKPEK
eukprot:477120_1